MANVTNFGVRDQMIGEIHGQNGKIGKYQSMLIRYEAQQDMSSNNNRPTMPSFRPASTLT